MDDDQPPILAGSKFSSFEESAEQVSDREFVEQLKDQGLMTRATVLERFTAQIRNTLFHDQTEQLENIKKNFEKCISPRSVREDEVVSKSMFTSFFSPHLGGFEDFIQEGISAIYASASVYGNFPFPPEVQDGLPFDEFLRAIAFMWDKQPYYPHDTFNTHESFMGSFGTVGGNLGQHRGAFISGRHRTQQDRRRLDFRALAIKGPGTQQLKEASNAKMTITYFKGYVSDEGFDDTYLELDFADEEDERGVDIVDVLSATFPEDPDPMAGSPMLCSFRSVSKSLPKQQYFLYELRIPYSRLFGLVKLLLLVQLEDLGHYNPYFSEQMERLSTSAEWIMNSFSEGEDVDWETFDGVIKQNLPALFLGGLHHIAKLFLLDPGRDNSPPHKSLLNYPTNHSSILTYSLLAQLHTFFPQRSNDINWKNLRLLQCHSRSFPLSFNTLQSTMKAYSNPTILLISGYQTNMADRSSKQYVVVGALIDGSWVKEQIEDSSETQRLWKTILFQLAPVQQVYTTREGDHDYLPILQSNGIGIGREVSDITLGTEMGTTGLIVNSSLDKAIFEHGKKNSRGAQFEGICASGTGKEGLVEMEISTLEVWGC